MRTFLVLVTLFFTANASAELNLDFKSVDKIFSAAGYPYLEYYVETAIPGRCVHKFDTSKTKASVILISVGEKGFEIAPLTLNNQPVDFFDDMSWIEIFTLFPEVATQFFDVVPLSNVGLKMVKKDLWGVDTAEIRENKDYFIVKTYKNDKFFRYCYYRKML